MEKPLPQITSVIRKPVVVSVQLLRETADRIEAALKMAGPKDFVETQLTSTLTLYTYPEEVAGSYHSVSSDDVFKNKQALGIVGKEVVN